MHIQWLPAVLRRFSNRTFWSTSTARRKPRSATRISRGLESLEDRSLLAADLIGINLPPLGLVDNYSVLTNTPISSAVSVLANDSDPNSGDILHAQLITGPLHGSLELGSDGQFVYTPQTGYVGLDTFSYIPTDGLLPGLPTLVTLVVGLDGAPPVANDDAFAVAENSILNLSLGTQLDGVLANDTDADSALLTANLVTFPQHGTLTFLPAGTFIYTPDADFTGIDTFTYQASDLNSLSNIATATITVVPVGPGGNNAPVAVNDTFHVNQDSLLNVALPGVLVNDTDADGNLLIASLVTGPTHGTLLLLPTGQFTYTPDAGYSGPDSFTYQASDLLSNSNIATVSIIVDPSTGGAGNQAPVAVNDTYNVTEDSLLNVAVGGVLQNDTDADGNLLTAVLVTPPQHGTLVLLPTGMFTYTPDANYTGPDSFTYQASDLLSLSNVATVSITVTGTNDAPVAINDSYTTATSTALNVPAATGVLANDTDADNQALTAAIVANPANGAVTLNPDGSFTYTPTAGFTGTDTFTYQASDGMTNSNTATVTITIAGVANDPPTAQDDTYNLNEDVMLTTTPANGVLFNDSDTESDPLTATLVSNPTHGTVLLNPNGTFTYTPDSNYSGTDSFTYQASDGTSNSNVATVTLNIAALNDAPTGGDDAYDVDEGGTLTVSAPGVLSNDTDAEGDSLTAVLVTNVSQGTLTLNANGSFTYTPAAGFNGADTFTYQANDGSANSAPITVTLTVNAVNSAPVAVNDAYAVNEDATLTVAAVGGVLSNDTDADGDTLAAGIVTLPTHGTLALNSDGSFTYTPDADFQGTDTFSYRATDGTANSNVGTVQITVNPVNDAPVGANDTYSTTAGATLTIAANGVLTNDTDVDGDILTSTTVSNPANGTLTLNSNGSFTYTPAAGFTGTDTFTYQVNDGTTSSAPVTVSILVNAAPNTAPVSSDDAYTVGEDGVLTVAAGGGLLTNDTDAENDTLTANIVTVPQHGTLTLNPDGSFTYTPTANYNGSDSFTYRANDGTVDGNIATVSLTITVVNDAPVGNSDAYSTTAGTALVVPAAGVLTNDTDTDGNTLTATTVTNPSHGTLTLNTDGSFTYTPTAGFTGTDTFTYQANDGTTNSGPVTVSIQVNAAANTAPVSVNDTYAVNEDQVLTVAAGNGVLVNDTDVDGNPLTATIVSLPAHGTVTLNADGSFVYTPAADFNGSDSFTYRANDGTADGNIATVNLTVTAQGEAPMVTTTAGNRTVKGHRKLVLDPGATVTDADSTNFGGGRIRVAILTGDGSTPGRRDQVTFLRGGANRGRVNIRRGELRVGRVVVGTYTGGVNGAPLQIELNSNATLERVRTVLQNIIFRGTNRSGGPRIVTIQVTDETQLASNVATKTVDVT